MGRPNDVATAPTSRMTTGNFEPPVFDAALSLEAYLHDCPAEATTLGTFFQYVYASLGVRSRADMEAACEGLSTRRWVAFKHYPLSDFIRLAHNTARIGHSGVSRGEGLRRLGRMAYPSFASTMAGRVVIFAFGDKLEDVLNAAPKSYRLALPRARVAVQRLGESHYNIEMRDAFCFPETYHCGVIEGCVQAYGFEPKIKLRRHGRGTDVDFEVRWQPRAR
jgi:uncharacterized protein (TIGR02265 family)